jgi:alpha-amylase
MPSICIYFQVHQPIRLRNYTVFDIGKHGNYFDDDMNKFYLERVARKCYTPTNAKILQLINDTSGAFRVSYSITGILIDALEKWFPDVLDSFVKLVDTGAVELFDETYYHSLAFLVSKQEFKEQVKLHRERVKEVFGVTPKIFRNTEAMYSNEIAKTVEGMGYKAIIAEGLQHILGWRSPNHLYNPPDSSINVFLRNFKMSDDVGFRFSTKGWEEWPLTADKYASWLSAADGDIVNIFLDYETFGEHQWEDTGIFNFLEHLPKEALKHQNVDFRTPSEIVDKCKPVGVFDVPYISSWADIHRDLSAWLENDMQQEAFSQVKALEEQAHRKGGAILDTWRKLLTSDHFYYMCTKWFADGDVHKYFNCYNSPYEAFLNYMNILKDLRSRMGMRGAKLRIPERHVVSP